MVRYRVRDLTNQSQGGGRGPHGVQWEPPQSVLYPPDLWKQDQWRISIKIVIKIIEEDRDSGRGLLMVNCFNINRHGAYGTPRSVFSNIMHR